MRTLLHTFVAALLCGPLQAQQAPAIEWERSFGGTGADWFNGVVENSDGSLVFVGHSVSSDGDATFNHGLRDLWVVKGDGPGPVLWQHSYGGSDHDDGKDIYATTDGGYIVAGFTRSNNGDVTQSQGGEDVWVLKLNAQGAIQWQKTFGGPGNDGANAVIQTSDGGYLVAGYSGAIGGNVTSNHGGGSDQWLIKLSSSGTLQWQRSMGSLDGDEAFDVIEVSGGGYVVVGYAYSGGDVTANNGLADLWVVKLNELGEIIWEYSYGGTLNDGGRSIEQVQDEGFIVTGTSQSSNGYVSVNYGIADVWLVRLDVDGIFLWDASFGGTVSDIGTSIIQTDDGNYVICGFTFSTNGHVENNYGENDYWIIKTDQTGELLWQRTMGGSAIDNAYDLVQTADGGYVLVGYAYSSDGDISIHQGGVSDAWVVKLEPDDLSTTIRSSTDSGMVSIYPNPANDQVQIIFTDAEDAQFPVELLDANGRAIPSSAYGVARNGRSSITLHIGDLPQGMYIVKVATGNGVVAGRFVKI